MNVDIVDFFDGTMPMSWLMEYYDMLPEDSRTKAALAEDEEYAVATVSSLPDEFIKELSEQKGEEPEVPIAGYTKTNAQLDSLKDAVDRLRYTIVDMFASKKDTKDRKPTKRPETAIQRELRKRIWEWEREDAQDLMSEFGF